MDQKWTKIPFFLAEILFAEHTLSENIIGRKPHNFWYPGGKPGTMAYFLFQGQSQSSECPLTTNSTSYTNVLITLPQSNKQMIKVNDSACQG